MPRGQKSKSRARAKRQQARSENKNLEGTLSSAAEEAESPGGQVGAFGSDRASTSQGSESAGASHAGSSGSGSGSGSGSKADVQGSGVDVCGKDPSASQEVSITQPPVCPELLDRKGGVLMEFLLEKFKAKEIVTEGEVLHVLDGKFQGHFPDLLRKISARMQMVFGMDVRPTSSSSKHTYVVVSKLGLSHEEILSRTERLPKNVLLASILSLIFAKGNRASEEEVWEFLNMFGVYAGRDHLILGDTRKLISEDLVQENYLEIRQVPESDPPRYDYLWGSQSYIEDDKMKALDVWAKIHDASPRSFPHLYDEALRDQAERAAKRSAALGCPLAMVRFNRRYKSHSSSEK